MAKARKLACVLASWEETVIVTWSITLVKTKQAGFIGSQQDCPASCSLKAGASKRLEACASIFIFSSESHHVLGEKIATWKQSLTAVESVPKHALDASVPKSGPNAYRDVQPRYLRSSFSPQASIH